MWRSQDVPENPEDFAELFAASDLATDGIDDPALHALLERLLLPATADELAAEVAIVGAMAQAIATGAAASAVVVRRSVGERWRAAKMATRAAIVTGGVLVGASTAAATGSLPDAAQSVVARATSHFGIDLPDPRSPDVADTVADAGTEPSTTAPGDTTTPSSAPGDTAVTDTAAGETTTVPDPGSTLPGDAAGPTTSAVDDTTDPTPMSVLPAPPGGVVDPGANLPDPVPTVTTPSATSSPPPTSPATTTTAFDSAPVVPDTDATTTEPTTTEPDTTVPEATDAPQPDGSALFRMCSTWAEQRADGTLDDHSLATLLLRTIALLRGQTIEAMCADVLGTTTTTTTTTVDTTPVDTTPVDTTPVDTTPVDTTPVDTTPPTDPVTTPPADTTLPTQDTTSAVHTEQQATTTTAFG